MSCSGISWATCKSAPRSRQITMPVPHHSVFYSFLRPSCRPTNSVKALKAQKFQDHIRLVHKYLHFACSDVTDRLLYPNSYRIGNCRKLSPTEFTLTTSHHETRDVNWRLDPTQLSSIVWTRQFRRVGVAMWTRHYEQRSERRFAAACKLIARGNCKVLTLSSEHLWQYFDSFCRIFSRPPYVCVQWLIWKTDDWRHGLASVLRNPTDRYKIKVPVSRLTAICIWIISILFFIMYYSIHQPELNWTIL